MKKVNYNTLAKAMKEIRRTEENDNIRVAIYINEEMPFIVTPSFCRLRPGSRA